MSSGRKKGARGNNISPSSSPPLPPPPSQAQSNRGSAAPHHFEPALATSANVSGSRSPKNLRAKRPSTTPSSTPPISSVPSDHATRNNGTTIPQQHEVVVIRKRGKPRRWIARILLVYLSYTFLFICPNLPNQKSNQVCDAFARFQDWLRPYTEPVAVKIDETYRTYAEPLVDQYGRPMYQQSQQYYFDYAQPAFKTASVKAKENYHQYAHPHVVKAYEALYTDDVKAQVHKAQTRLHHYQKQAHEQLEFVKHKSKAANDHVWHLHATHVHPVIEKISPHAKVAWEKASLGANRLYDGATVFYLTHVNPYAQESWIYVQEAIDQAGDVVTKKADEIWGTSLYKAHQARKKARAKKAHVKESLKDTMLRKASEAQKAAGAYSETLKAAVMGDKAKAHAKAHPKGHDFKGAATEKGHKAQKKAQGFVETITKKAHEAQKIVSDEAEYIKKLADDKVHEAGKVSDKIKKTVVEKAREAQEAVARKAENIKHSVVDTVHGAEEAVEHELEHLQKAAADKKLLLEKMAKQEANAIKRAAAKKEKEAETAFKDASDQVHKAYQAAEHEAETIKAKVVKAGHEAEKDARQHVKDAQHVVEEQVKHAQDVAHEDAEWIQKKAFQAAKDAAKAAEGAKHTVEDTIKHARETAEEDAEWIKKKANQAAKDATKAAESAKHSVEDAIKHAREVAQNDAEWIKGSAQHVLKDASKGAKDAEHVAEHQAKAAQKAAQDATDSARKHAQDAKHAVRDQIHQAHEVVYESMDMAGQIVMSSKEQVDEKIKGASVKVEKAKDATTHKAHKAHDAHDAHMASKVALAAMLAGIEKTFSQFYQYEETETENLWNKLQSAIDEHIASAKKSARELEKANKETFETFEGYVKGWASEAGDLEERLSKLGQQQVDSIKKIGQRAETHQGAGKSKAQILTNNVDVYITGLRDFLSERLAASRETVASELGVFKDTSSADDEHQAREKLAALEKGAREKLKTAGADARDKAHELLKQIDEIWAQSEAMSKEYVQRTRDLAVTAGEEAKVAIRGTKEPKGPKKAKGLVDETEPDVRVAPEEPGSGHRHHRH
ncbi:hypothetical protein BGZ74_008257 [Mortierella antarctica]|nr:hypothetical protein BGZ74_008257 [Mortierella antarctica]